MNLEQINAKQYLGDSVYVRFDGYCTVLTTENGYGGNEIILEPAVASALKAYWLNLETLIAEYRKATP